MRVMVFVAGLIYQYKEFSRTRNVNITLAIIQQTYELYEHDLKLQTRYSLMRR